MRRRTQAVRLGPLRQKGRPPFKLRGERSHQSKKKRASINEARKRLSAKNLVRGRNDADEASATAFVFELHVAGDESKQRVVLALTDVFASLMLRAALAHEDRARVDELAAEPLYAKPLTV